MAELIPFKPSEGTRAPSKTERLAPASVTKPAEARPPVKLPVTVPIPKPAPPATKPLPPAAVLRPISLPVKPMPKPAPLVKPAKPSSNDVRNARREVAKTQSPEARVVAAALIPETPRSMAGKLATQAAVLQSATQMVARDAIEEARKKQVVAAEAGKLAGLVVASQAMREPAKVDAAPVVQVPPEVAKARILVLTSAQKDLEKQEKDVKAAAAKAPNDAVRAGLETQAKLLEAKKREAAKRRALLAKGQDLNKPHRVPPAQVSKPRELLPVPPAFVPPDKGEVVAVAQVLTAALPPRANETAKQRRLKVRGLLERTLARLARKQTVVGKTPAAVQEAVAETIRLDEPVIDAEVKETGGLAHDNAAEIFEPLIEDAAVEVDRAAVSVAPVTPAVEPSPAQVAQVLAAAEQEIIKDAQEPKETWDEIREDIVLADQTLPPTPFWQKPRVWAGGALLLAFILWMRSR